MKTELQEAINALREAGWKLEDIAKATGVSMSTIYRWSNGYGKPTEIVGKHALAKLNKLVEDA